MSKHLVYKQKVTLHLPKKENAYALQDRVSKLLQNELLDTLENILDNAFPPDKIVRIDSLQLNLGNISAQNFEPEFKAHFIAELTKSLASKNESLTNADGKETIISKAQSLENALIFFLEKGYLPWYSSVTGKTDWETEILNNLTENEYLDFLTWLNNNSQERPVIVKRLISQFSDKFIGDILVKINPAFDDRWEVVFNDYLLISNNFNISINDSKPGENDGAFSDLNERRFAFRKSDMRTTIWQHIFHVLLNFRDGDHAFLILKLLFNNWGINSKNIDGVKAESNNKSISFKTKTVRLAFEKLITQLTAETTRNKPLTGKKKKNDDEIEGVAPERITNDKNSNKDTNKGADKNKNNDSDINNGADNSGEGFVKDGHVKNDNDYLQSEKGPGKTHGIKKDTGANESDIINVNNSGVVMLHPFLKAYFEGLELLADGKFINGDACSRAVFLLHYLATGEAEAAEFDLTLQKILCGYPMEDTLPSAIILTDKEKTESDNLLKAVLEYWEPLKNTSLEGFRSTFLQRAGNLELRESGWLLIVEQKTIDILLGKLPWGFSTIRLPWMQNMLSVDWC